MGSKLQSRDDGSKFGVHVLVVIFGITSWSIMNGLWVELPILVSHLPEEWTLPSYLTIISQFGNVGPLAFSLVAYLAPKTKLEIPASFVIATALTVCSLMYALFWKHTSYLAGGEYSVALFGLTFCQAIFASTTSITYVTFMAHLKARYMASIFIGMGLSGLIPAIAALGQGLGNVRCVHNTSTASDSWNGTNGYTAGIENSSLPSTGLGHSSRTAPDMNDTVVILSQEPSFTVQGFFLMLAGIGMLSLVSFLLLVYHPYCQTEHVDTDKEENCQLVQNPHSSRQDNGGQTSESSHKDFDVQLPAAARKTNVKSDNEGEERVKKNSTVTTEMTVCDINSSGTDGSPDVSFNIQGHDLETKDEAGKVQSKTDMKVINYDDLKTAHNNNKADSIEDVEKDSTEEKSDDKERQLTKFQSWYLLGLLVWINALQSSFILAIQVYSSLPYGIEYYHGATKAENIVDPLASFLTFWISANTVPVISGLTLLGTLFTAYIVTVAAMSPEPFLVADPAGGALVVTAWILCTMFMIFTKVSIAKIMRGQGRLSLMWTGASTQLGALLGAILAYVLVNGLKVFKDEPWCR